MQRIASRRAIEFKVSSMFGRVNVHREVLSFSPHPLSFPPSSLSLPPPLSLSTSLSLSLPRRFCLLILYSLILRPLFIWRGRGGSTEAMISAAMEFIACFLISKFAVEVIAHKGGPLKTLGGNVLRWQSQVE